MPLKKQESENEIIWQIPEYVYRQKDVSWRWLSLIITIFLIAFAAWQKNFLFAVFAAIVFFVMNYMANQLPPIWRAQIDKNGVSLKTPAGEIKKFYPFEKIEGFWIRSDYFAGNEKEEFKELVLKIKEKISPFLKINIYPEDEKDIDNFLSKFIPKEEYPESFAESLQKMIGF
ncbi:hypothetical protein HZC33_02585 [Candidatus Wolfebacteria bacterium]|nr:hypothetical protein [Candidatus Wolfebacteria bacterium]